MYPICGFAKVLSPQIIGPANRKSTNRKNMWSANRKSKIATLVEVPQILKKTFVRKIADLRFAELICGPSTSAPPI
jgi:hypothetical protein